MKRHKNRLLCAGVNWRLSDFELTDIEITCAQDLDDYAELRPGEFVVVFINRNAGELGVGRDPFDARPEQVGPMGDFRRRGGGSGLEYFEIGSIVTRVRG